MELVIKNLPKTKSTTRYKRNFTSEFYQMFKVLFKKLKRGKHFQTHLKGQHHTGQNQKRTPSEKKTTLGTLSYISTQRYIRFRIPNGYRCKKSQ